jgi:Integrase core domain
LNFFSRLAYAEVLPDEKAVTAVDFLRRAVAFYRRYGIQVEAILTDNGAAYISIKHALACRRLRLKHLRSRPYRPQTNGKAVLHPHTDRRLGRVLHLEGELADSEIVLGVDVEGAGSLRSFRREIARRH